MCVGGASVKKSDVDWMPRSPLIHKKENPFLPAAATSEASVSDSEIFTACEETLQARLRPGNIRKIWGPGANHGEAWGRQRAQPAWLEGGGGTSHIFEEEGIPVGDSPGQTSLHLVQPPPRRADTLAGAALEAAERGVGGGGGRAERQGLSPIPGEVRREG